ncbi:MAG: GGDEF domain-containing protein [Sulfuricurvum sp.]|jgi:diguanylate cyclase (GGDEF)-like protein|uniref:GGDEF domain-containing protein n=1 Tax=Sulfuricurvum sp. TaxID=2025608 RepID=UPI0025F1D1E2|nr:diguanylate cyclase [Sulfuricurvum sp.]MCK9373015.1 GGDEF domain-containing protein [Sulfuricurvum sp.]
MKKVSDLFRYLLPEKGDFAVTAEQIRLLYHQGNTIQILGIVAAGVSVIMFWNVADHLLLSLWFTALFLLSVIRLIANFRFTQISFENPDTFNKWKNIYLLGTFLSGCLWSMLAFFYDPSWPAPNQVMLFILFTGIIAGALNSNSSVFIAFPAFYLPLVFSLMYVMLSQTDEGFYPLLTLFIIYTALMYISSLKYHNRLTHSLRLRFENEQLAEKLAQYNKRLLELADTDELTGLHNRRSLNRYLRMASNQHFLDQHSLSLIFIDLDYFKQYNDTYGHERGDQCLVQIATILKSNARQSSDMMTRYGGEEFTLILANTNARQARLIAERIRQDLNQLHLPHAASPISDHVTISIGIVTMIPQQPDSCAHLLSIADKALYEAKKTGRNRIVHASEESFADKAD